MKTLIVEPPADRAGAPPLVHLGPGDRVTFGRGAADVPVDIALNGPGVSRRAGEILAYEDFWLVSNFSAESSYIVENLEGAGEYVKVAPLRLGMPVPFELSRLVLPGEDPLALKVYAPAQAFGEVSITGLQGEPTASAFPLDVSARYFLILLALCEPRLRDPAAVRIPTGRQVAERLNAVGPGGNGLSVSAVNFHINYLAEHKLRIREPDLVGGERMNHRREAVVAVALRFDLVRQEHLALLPALRSGPP